MRWFACIKVIFDDDRHIDEGNASKPDSYRLMGVRPGVMASNRAVVLFVANVSDDYSIKSAVGAGVQVGTFSQALFSRARPTG